MREDWLERVAGVKQWSRSGVRALHEPLLLLCAIGRWVNEGTSRVRFRRSHR